MRKVDWTLLPWDQVEDVVRALMAGAAKHGDWTWQRARVDIELRRKYQGALVRHVKAYMCGERRDEETGLHPLAHAAANCLFLIWADKRGSE